MRQSLSDHICQYHRRMSSAGDWARRIAEEWPSDAIRLDAYGRILSQVRIPGSWPGNASQFAADLFRIPAAQKFHQLGNHLTGRFVDKPMPGAAHHDAFHIFGDQPALLNQEIAGSFFTG